VGRQFREAHRGDSARLSESLLNAIRKREAPEDVAQSRDDHGALASARRESMKRPGPDALAVVFPAYPRTRPTKLRSRSSRGSEKPTAGYAVFV